MHADPCYVPFSGRVPYRPVTDGHRVEAVRGQLRKQSQIVDDRPQPVVQLVLEPGERGGRLGVATEHRQTPGPALDVAVEAGDVARLGRQTLSQPSGCDPERLPVGREVVGSGKRGLDREGREVLLDRPQRGCDLRVGTAPREDHRATRTKGLLDRARPVRCGPDQA